MPPDRLLAQPVPNRLIIYAVGGGRAVGLFKLAHLRFINCWPSALGAMFVVHRSTNKTRTHGEFIKLIGAVEQRKEAGIES